MTACKYLQESKQATLPIQFFLPEEIPSPAVNVLATSWRMHMRGPATFLPMDLSFRNSIPHLNPLTLLIFKSYMVVRNTIIHYIKSITTFYMLVGIFTGYSLVLKLWWKISHWYFAFWTWFWGWWFTLLKTWGNFQALFPKRGFLIHSPSR